METPPLLTSGVPAWLASGMVASPWRWRMARYRRGRPLRRAPLSSRRGVTCITALAGSGPGPLRRQRVGQQRRRRLEARPAGAKRFRQYLADRSRKRDTTRLQRRPGLARRLTVDQAGSGRLRGLGALTCPGAIRAAPEGGWYQYGALPAYPGRIAPAAERVLACDVCAAQPARRVRVAGRGLPQPRRWPRCRSPSGCRRAEGRPQLLRIAAGRRREASRHTQAVGADHVGRSVREADWDSSRASACRAAPMAPRTA